MSAEIRPLRCLLFLLAALFVAGAWFGTAGNSFRSWGAVCWIASVALVWIALDGPTDLPPSRRLSAAAGVALLGILGVAAALRLADLAAAPPDMTSDHVEKLLDVQRILDGQHPVFMGSNGGREGLHFYTLAALAVVTGHGLDFELLKLGSAIVGVLGVGVAFWAGREIAGGSAAELTGLLAAALTAVSWWHVMLSRLGLRIVWAPLFVCLVAGFLARGLRSGRRRDFLAAGLALGLGLNAYQALRMLPVFVLAGWGLTLVLRPSGQRDSRASLRNIAVLALVAAAVCVPLARFAHDAPVVFWERVSGRIFDDVAPWPQGAGAVLRQLGVNAVRTAGMFHVRGDSAWITGDPAGAPALDRLTGALLLAGIVLLGTRIVRRRDPGDILVLTGFAVMLLPTALAVGRPIEVPSATRASGALPFVMFLAAAAGVRALLPLSRAAGPLAAAACVVLGLAYGLAANAREYFGNAMSAYRASTFPYREAGQLLAGFARAHGAPGNVFMVAAPHWWDHRAVGIESGDPRWDNGLLPESLSEGLAEKMGANAGTPRAFRPEAPLFFFVEPSETKTLAALSTRFSLGRARRIATSRRGRDVVVFRAERWEPPSGAEPLLGSTR